MPRAQGIQPEHLQKRIKQILHGQIKLRIRLGQVADVAKKD